MSDTDTDTPISPEDEPTKEEIEAAKVMRPLAELPSPFTIKGNPRLTSEVSLKALSPEDAKAVREAARSADPDDVKEALFGFLRSRSEQFRIMAGTGEGASETEREALSLANQQRLYSEEYLRLEAELAAVGEGRVETDANGEQFLVPVPVLQGSQRTWREARMRELAAAMTSVAGIEGEVAMERAARTEALNRRKVKIQIEDQQEATRRAHQKAREKRIEEAAAAKAKFL